MDDLANGRFTYLLVGNEIEDREGFEMAKMPYSFFCCSQRNLHNIIKQINPENLGNIKL
jgi:hypothetical protein